MGDWYVWYKAGPVNRSAFGPNVSKSYSNFTDGLSNTRMVFSGVPPEWRTISCVAAPLGPLTPTSYPSPQDSPALIASLAPSCTKTSMSNTTWANGNIFDSGMTTALTPNFKVLIKSRGSTPYDLDTIDESNGGPVYAAITFGQLSQRGCQHPDGRRIGPIRQGWHQRDLVAALGHDRRRRGNLGRRVLIPSFSTTHARRLLVH